jgi:hypothetical protein
MSAMTEPDAPPAAAEHVALLAAYEAEAARIRAMPPGQEAFDASTRLGEVLDRLVGRAALLRGEQARRIYDAENLALQPLGQRFTLDDLGALIGVKRARAGALIARTDEGRDTE